MQQSKGFTLLEILVALFVFTILSMVLMSALHHVIDIQQHTEAKAMRLRQLQMALLTFAKDVEQTIDRSINNGGKREAAFIGSAKGFTFTHGGYANPNGQASQSHLQRARYQFSEQAIWRLTWPKLDGAAVLKPNARLLLHVSTAYFSYLDKEGHFHSEWPIGDEKKQALPCAVKMTLTFSDWGTLSQLYAVPQTHES